MLGIRKKDKRQELLTEGRSLMTERAERLVILRSEQDALTTAQAEVDEARNRAAGEEFEAAQEDGGLAIASRATLQLVADLELRVKSIQFRIAGKQKQIREVEERLLEVWRDLEATHTEARELKVSEVSSAFDECIAKLQSLHTCAWALMKISPEGTLVNPTGMYSAVFANPISGEVGAEMGLIWVKGQPKEIGAYASIAPESAAILAEFAERDQQAAFLKEAVKEISGEKAG